MVTADCKGVPRVREALPPEEESDTPLPILANRRRGKGEKANQKKMAAVGAGIRSSRLCERPTM